MPKWQFEYINYMISFKYSGMGWRSDATRKCLRTFGIGLFHNFCQNGWNEEIEIRIFVGRNSGTIKAKIDVNTFARSFAINVFRAWQCIGRYANQPRSIWSKLIDLTHKLVNTIQYIFIRTSSVAHTAVYIVPLFRVVQTNQFNWKLFANFLSEFNGHKCSSIGNPKLWQSEMSTNEMVWIIQKYFTNKKLWRRMPTRHWWIITTQWESRAFLPLKMKKKCFMNLMNIWVEKQLNWK